MARQDLSAFRATPTRSALYYNADMFRAKGLDPDKPPQDLVGTVAQPRRSCATRRRTCYGFGFCATQAEEGVFQWLPFLWQAGGSIDKLDQPEAAAALQYWADMVQHDIASKDVINQSQYEVTNTFMAGNTAIVQGGPWELPRMSEDGEVRLAPRAAAGEGRQADQGRSALGGYDFVVPKGAAQVDGAFRFIEFMSNPEDPERGLEERPPRAARAMWWCRIRYGRRPMRHIASRCSTRGRADRIRNGRTSRAPMQIAIQQAITGAKPAAEALKDAAAKIKPILAKRRSEPLLGGVGAARHAARRRSRHGRPVHSVVLLRFLAVPMLYLLALIGFPVVYNVVMSVQEVNLGNIVDLVRPFVGLDNYRERSPIRRSARCCVNSAVFVGVNVVGQVGIGLAVALFFAATLSRRALHARPAARVLDAAGAGRRRAVEMDVRHRIRRRQFRAVVASADQRARSTGCPIRRWR